VPLALLAVLLAVVESPGELGCVALPVSGVDGLASGGTAT
jgi:hypothetical protein